MSKNIRTSKFAGTFYPASSIDLQAMINGLLKTGDKSDDDIMIKAILVPHAGYVYSGKVAASAYQHLQGDTRGVVWIISNSHTAYFEGIVIDDNDSWKTPLGEVNVDTALAYRLVKKNDRIAFNKDAHAKDHVLEVQLPFLQTVLNSGFKILPILFGNSGERDYELVAKAIKNNFKENDLLVISSDLSHYPPKSIADKIDPLTISAIAGLSLSGFNEQIVNTEKKYPNIDTLCCGIDGIRTLISTAHMLCWGKARVCLQNNSGDSEFADKERVVGYGSVLFGQSKNKEKKDKLLQEELSVEEKKELLMIARNTVEAYVRTGKKEVPVINHERLQKREGAFVTLHKYGQLRGCIGSIVPREEPLWQVVRDMSISACSEDPRFLPVQEDELEDIDYEVSVLSEPTRIESWKKIELGKHGVIVKSKGRSGVFLPQVADETGWTLEHFLEELCNAKAGLHKDCYKDSDAEIFVFTANVFNEKNLLQ